MSFWNLSKGFSRNCFKRQALFILCSPAVKKIHCERKLLLEKLNFLKVFARTLVKLCGLCIILFIFTLYLPVRQEEMKTLFPFFLLSSRKYF